MKYYLGIDVGQYGAVAITDEAGEHIESHRHQEWKILGDVLSQYKDTGMAAVEQVSAMPKQGVSSMFSFGQNYGGWLALLDYIEIPYIKVTPAIWQKKILGSFPKGESKIRASDYIRRRFPALVMTKNKKVNEGLVDALCLALYIRENH